MTVTSSSQVPTSSPVPTQLQDLFTKGLLVQPRPDLYILGTVHIGSKSANDVQVLIDTVKPKNVIVEIPPSRLQRILQQKKKNINNNNDNNIDTNNNNMNNTEIIPKKQPKTKLIDAIRTLPALANEGYTKGGISGLLFSTIIVGGSLIKRSTTANEEKDTLPRVNEFEAAIHAAQNIDNISASASASASSTSTSSISTSSINIIPADIEFEDLIQSVAKSMTPLQWINIGKTIFGESIGILPTDPIRRNKDESMVEWESRRRNVNTARASRMHGDNATPELSRVLVQDRDAEFARICLHVLEKDNGNDGDKDNDDDDGSNVNVNIGGSESGNQTTVCIVGLVHVDGIADIIRTSSQKN